ncbi:MAG: hypothetical protein J6M17_04485 [Ruminococcus sp.]|nr:hypothetical protein [Ruminococcus sp.]
MPSEGPDREVHRRYYDRQDGIRFMEKHNDRFMKKNIDYAAKCSISLICQSGNSMSVNKQVLAEILRKEAIDAQTPDDHMRKQNKEHPDLLRGDPYLQHWIYI